MRSHLDNRDMMLMLLVSFNFFSREALEIAAAFDTFLENRNFEVFSM